jgi:hypothetical protein
MKANLTDSVASWYIFKPKNPNLGKFWKVLQWKMLTICLFYSQMVHWYICIDFMAICYILWSFGIFTYGHLVNFMSIWYIYIR